MYTFGLLALLAFAASAPAPSTCAPATAFTGTICVPAAAGRHPAILLLGGSEGGNALFGLAADYAAGGYVAVSIAYFGLPGLPQTLENVPVETVGAALATVKARADVDPERIAIYGMSKGGELALLAASTYRDIHAVVADVPSPFAWEGIPNGPSAASTSSWTLNGKPVPYVPYTAAMGREFQSAFVVRRPLDLRPAYDAAMANRSALEKAFFPLQKINGPVLFLSAGDDRIWNSAEQARLGLAYLKKMKHGFRDQSKEYPQAGHMFIFATPAQSDVDAPFAGGLTIKLGGSAHANVAAAEDAHARIAAFLATELRTQ